MKRLIHTIVVMLVAMSLQAQENRITPPQEDEKAVGVIGSTVDISSLGGATYTIPIQLPDGIDGMKPSLSIVYNSQAGNGLLGWGWNLGGLSSITRINHTNYHDGAVSGVDFVDDRFALDGQRLMVIDGSHYGANQAEYKTEIDGMSKIVSYRGSGFSGPKYFKVWTADGLVLEYGNAENARVVYEDNSGVKKVVIWLLNRVENRDGTYMAYNYTINHHDYKLDNIQYSGHAGTKTTEYGVDFHYYGRRIDKESGAIGNYMLYQPWLLKDINIYYWSKPISRYDFVYDSFSGQLNSPYYYNRLKEVYYECGGIPFHPTVIDWGDYPVITNNTSHPVDSVYLTTVQYPSYLYGTIQDKVKFVGDLNGDGFQDFICAGSPNSLHDEKTSDTSDMNNGVYSALVFLNTGHTKTDDDSGEAVFKALGRFNVGYNLRWIYVCDLDGDGIDEVLLVGDIDDGGVYYTSLVHYDIFKIGQADTGDEEEGRDDVEEPRWGARYESLTDTCLTFSVFGNGSDLIWDYHDVAEFHFTENKNYSFIVGDFLGKGHCDIIFTFPYKHFVYLFYDELAQTFCQKISNADWNGLKYTTGDFDGDGKTEVWFDSEFDNNPGVIAKVYVDNSNNISWYPLTHMMDKWNRNFTGDFNGDGHTDLLTYRKDTHTWSILLFEQSWHAYPVFDVTGPMSAYLDTLDPEINISYQIEGKEGMPYFIQVTDADGDGKSDVILRNQTKLAVLFGPPVDNGFTNTVEFDCIEVGVNMESACGLCLGNFLGQENVALLSTTRMCSLPQHSLYYNVSTIIDGMGNGAGFEYDYLTCNPRKETDGFYTLTDGNINLGHDIYHLPITTKATKRILSGNIHNNVGPYSIDSISYQNATVHGQGRGFLGFGKLTHDHWMIHNNIETNNCVKHQGKTTMISDYRPMGDHCMLLPDEECSYKYREDPASLNDFEEVLVSSTKYSYRKALCNRDLNGLGSKVFIPIVVSAITDEYELLGERRHLRRRIVENDYNDNQSAGVLAYDTVVLATESRMGTDEAYPNRVEECEFQTLTQTEYVPILNNASLWMPRRPHSVFTKSHRRTEGYADSEQLTVYSSYDNDRPDLPKYVKVYPSGELNNNDSLAMITYYRYFPSGKLKDESHYPLVGRSEDGFKTMYEYSAHYRFLKTKTEEFDTTHENDYETSYEYDEVYGNLISEIDCNGYSSYTENPDHLGLTIRTYNRDRDTNKTEIPGTETVTALRWFSGSGFECFRPLYGTPAYFKWTKREDAAESFTIFDYEGRELRRVYFGLREEGSDTIYQDMVYDNWGRLGGMSEPYYSDTDQNDIKWTVYGYDDFDRLTKTEHPSYVLGEELVKPFDIITFDGLRTKTATGAVISNDTLSHVVETEINVMGWTVTNKEYLDAQNTVYNTTTYGYNADGSLAWTKVNNDEATKISMQYDAAGNRVVLVDPDYGMVRSHYNAFGQLVWQQTPRGDSVIYHYDELGRRQRRLEKDINSGIIDTTLWVYYENTGQKGLLQSVKYGDNQIVTYHYDLQYFNNLTKKTEQLFGNAYTTGYSYDDIDFPLRLTSEVYPSGYSVEKGYDGVTGALTEIKRDNTILWKTRDTNALGQITKYETGNGVVSQREYDDRHFLSAQLATKGNVKIQDFAYRYDIFGNLAARIENKYTTPLEERFTYDYLNRLDSIILNNGTPNVMTYDAYGRIRSKMRDGQIVFDNAEYQFYDGNGSLKPHAISAANADGSAFGPFLYEGVTYNLFDKVDTINLANRKRFCFDYGYDHQRTRMTTINNGILELQKTYVDNTEFVTGGGNYTMTYLCGPMGVFAVVRTTNNAVDCQYVYKDHLGSWTTLTDDQGVIEQEQSFDAWGNCRNPQTWTDYPSNQDVFIRGFCGHEHLWITSYGRNDVGLINMNGRIYDPIMSSFLSVDNYVQQPDNSQNFNRYAYCLNNPLKYTDPDGESFIAAMLIAGTILGVYTGGVLANNDCNPINWDFGSCKTWGYMLFGGLTGLASAYVGIAVAGADFVMCNTAAIASASLVNSVGTWFYTGGQTDITISLGVVSYNFMKREFGYLGKEGNSIFENIGYGLGAFYNLADFYRLITWDALTYSEKCDKLLEATGQTDGDCLNYDATLSDNAAYNPNDNTIKIGETGLNRGRGWAKSSIMHEWDHFERYDYQAMMDGSPYMDENVLDFYAYQTEVNNVLNNGLSWREYNEVLSKTRYYLSQGGLYIHDPMAGFSNSFSSSYTLKMYLSWIRSFFTF